jgi:hypothetical protein
MRALIVGVHVSNPRAIASVSDCVPAHQLSQSERVSDPTGRSAREPICRQAKYWHAFWVRERGPASFADRMIATASARRDKR